MSATFFTQKQQRPRMMRKNAEKEEKRLPCRIWEFG